MNEEYHFVLIFQFFGLDSMINTCKSPQSIICPLLCTIFTHLSPHSSHAPKTLFLQNPLISSAPQHHLHKQRFKDLDIDTKHTAMNMNNGYKSTTKKKKMAMEKRGIRSLAIAVALPLSMTLFSSSFFGPISGYGTISKPFWFPPLWILHVTSLASCFFMGLSAWLVWAEGGFHKNPTCLYLYLAQLALSLVWYPIVFRIGASWVGLVACLAMFGALAWCSRRFRAVNPIAGDLVKPCLAWTAFLAVVNLTLVFV